VFLFLLSALGLLSVLLLLPFLFSFALAEDFAPLLSGSAPGPPVGAMFELSILSLLTVDSSSALAELTLVLELPPQAVKARAVADNIKIA
jgi:hypothetical protein